MNQIVMALKKRETKLQEIIKKASRNITDENGFIRISKTNNKTCYYHVSQKGDKHGKYLRDSEKEIAKRIINNTYNRNVLANAQKELAEIQKMLKTYNGDRIESIYACYSKERQEFIAPYEVTDELFIQEWLEAELPTNTINPADLKYTTKRGELVRSKSEALLANIYYDLDIPYRYEYPIMLKNGKTKFCDFAALKVSTREIIYHEHLGLIENAEYRANNIIKLDDYRKTGIYPGKNLILTYETDYSPLDILEIKKMIKDIFR